MNNSSRSRDKTSKNPIKIIPIVNANKIKKPSWIRQKGFSHDEKFDQIINTLKRHKLHTVCEEASCPNIHECFSSGTATFMIMGDVCTRRCSFCNVKHGKPQPLDKNEPINLANAIVDLGLDYVVITSVDRDDLLDGGASHFDACVAAIKSKLPNIKIEILVPDFRARLDKALDILTHSPLDVMNHNLETVKRMYKIARPGADYDHSLKLLFEFKKRTNNKIITKSGIMVGLGETDDEVRQIMHDMRMHDIDIVTIGQYLQPSSYHIPVDRFCHPDQFEQYKLWAKELGFRAYSIGPMVRSSYHAQDTAR